MAANLDLLGDELRDAARALVDAASVAGLQPRVTSTLRSRAEQTRLYRRYLAGHAGFPVAPPGASAHEYGLAFDMVVSPMDALADVGYTWQSWGGGWNPGDAIHFEALGATQLAKQNAQQLISEQGGFWSAQTAIDFLTGFVPVYGEVTTVAAIMQVLGVKESEAINMLASPTHYINELHRVYLAFK